MLTFSDLLHIEMKNQTNTSLWKGDQLGLVIYCFGNESCLWPGLIGFVWFILRPELMGVEKMDECVMWCAVW